jgi:hypothetical protein
VGRRPWRISNPVIAAAEWAGAGREHEITQRSGAPSEGLSVREHEFAKRNHANHNWSSEAQAMTFVSSVSGRACLNDWGHPLAVNDILNLLLSLKQAVATAGDHVILMLVLRETIPVPAGFLLKCIQGTLPAILDCCAHLVIVVEGLGSDRALLRAAFETTRQTPTKRTPPRVFDSLSAAFAYSQQFAPHDVLELQRHVLHQSFPPNGGRS